MFDYHTAHARLVVDLGYSSLLRGITNTFVLNSMAILAIGLDLPESFMDLLRARSVDLGQSVEVFRERVSSTIVSERMRRNRT